MAGLLVLLVSLTAVSQTTKHSKGYQLYSWKIKGHWYYSLLPGKNVSRSYEEITAAKAVQRDAAGLKSALQKLSRGDEVFWMADAPLAARKSESGVPLDIKHPSRARIKGIKAMCAKLGISLKLS
jgi:hypothetical protein